SPARSGGAGPPSLAPLPIASSRRFLLHSPASASQRDDSVYMGGVARLRALWPPNPPLAKNRPAKPADPLRPRPSPSLRSPTASTCRPTLRRRRSAFARPASDCLLSSIPASFARICLARRRLVQYIRNCLAAPHRYTMNEVNLREHPRFPIRM